MNNLTLNLVKNNDVKLQEKYGNFNKYGKYGTRSVFYDTLHKNRRVRNFMQIYLFI